MQPGKPPQQWTADYYVYPIFFSSLAPGADAQGSIEIQADSDFEWLSSTYHAFNTAAPEQTADSTIVPPITVQIQDTGSGRNLFDLPAVVSTVFGIGALPYILPISRIFRARSSILFTVSSFAAGGGTTFGLRLNLHGRKLFEYKQ